MKFTTTTTAESWLPDITDLSERLLLGPQRTILELIEQVNSRYGLTLRATKTYRWSPGYKLQMKGWMANDYLEPHMDRKISTYFNQIDQKRWQYDQFKRLLNDIDTKMANNRREGAVFQDNTGILEDKIYIFKNRLESQLEEANNQFNSAYIHVNARILTNEDGKDYFSIKVSLPPGKMDVFIGNNPYPIDIGAVDLWFTTGLDALVYALCSHNSTVTDDEFRLSSFFNDGNRYGGYYGSIKYLGIYYPEYACNNPDYTLRHPYISQHYNSVTQIDDNRTTYICLGQLLENVHTQLEKMDLVSLCATLMTWHSCFHAGRTHPLNGISKSFYGLQYTTAEFRNIANVSSSLDCRHNYIEDNINLDEHDTGYCDDISCFFRKDCNMYRTVNGDIKQPEVVVETPELELPDIDLDVEMRRMTLEYERQTNDMEVEAEMVREDVQAEADAYNENNETPEEQVIRWAAEHGGAINIGDRS